MALLGRVWSLLGRLVARRGRAASPRPPGAAPRRLGDLLAPPPLEVVAAEIEGAVARVTLRDPVPAPLDEVTERRLLETAWRALRADPVAGPVRALEVWAPPAPGRAPERALRREFAAPLEVPPLPEVHAGPHPEPHFASLGERASAVRAEPPAPAGVALRPLGEFLRVPERLEARLRARGVDPRRPVLDRLVEALLAEVGARVTARRERGRTVDLEVAAPAGRALVRCRPAEGHVPVEAVDRFAFAFLSSRADEGFLFTDGLLPFECRHWERDPRIHLVDRVGLQRLVEAVDERLAAPAGA